MEIAVDPINALGLTFNIIILLLGYWSYKKSQNKVPLYISIAFLLFAIAYIIALIGQTSEGVFIIRAIAYIILTFAVYKSAF